MDRQHAVTTTNQYPSPTSQPQRYSLIYITHGIYKYGDEEDLTMVLQ